MCSFNHLSFTLAYHTLHTDGLSLISKFVLLLPVHHLDVCASIGSPIMCRTKWPTPDTLHFGYSYRLHPSPVNEANTVK